MNSPSLSFSGGFAVILALTIFYGIVRSLHLLYFHPLSKYPGPRLAAITDGWYAWHFDGGRWVHVVHELHKKYGDVIRIAPNELSFATLQSYPDIYGHAIKGKKTFLKSSLYDTGSQVVGVINSRDPIEASRQRKYLSNGFSNKSLRDQEVLIHTYVDLFIEQLGKLGSPGSKGIDMSRAFNWITFDIVGDLAFGEPFQAVENACTHPWIALIFDAARWSILFHVKERFPLLKFLIPFLVPKDMVSRFEQHHLLTKQKTQKRIELGTSNNREDFFAYMMRKGGLSEAELQAQASVLIIAGSETTSTALSGILHLLLTNPECLSALQKEVRERFSSLNEITGDSTRQLPFLIGVIEEGLRMFSPTPIGRPRISPGAMVDGHYVPAGTLVSTHPTSLSYDPRYWYRPEKFLPERWIGDGYGDEKRASKPFSSGPRACMGTNLAYLEMRIIIAKMIFAYDWERKSEGDWMGKAKFYSFWEKPENRVVFHPRPIETPLVEV
ncbi:cytochrome P450 [Corynespora cassiicola Philippines]|uniref:Cytochrome P450 n=1 Tax=Corynespora cassiicola Philippines TaxID=1448308 RepID=A0A2T2N864_CORCC|nr:cytochrome P450 [Corynespora cassiicola Philippines]